MKPSISEIILELGELPLCQCNCKQYINIHSYMYLYYKKHGYPKFINGHYNKTEEQKKKIYERMINNNPMDNPEIRAKHVVSVNTLEFKNKQRLSKLGVPHSLETRLKQSKSLKGKPKSEQHCKHISESHVNMLGEKNPNYGNKYSEKTKKTLSNFAKLRVDRLGSNWKGGKSISYKKRKEKRRDFESNPLNERFPNSEEHHIDKQTTIFLPKEIHNRSMGIIHNLHTGYHMEIINTLSYFFLVQQNIQKLGENKYDISTRT